MANVLTQYEPTLSFDPVARATCFHCEQSTMLCECEDLEPGKDMAVRTWDLPAIPSNDPELYKKRLARFQLMSRVHPFNIRIKERFDWSAYFNDQLDQLLVVFARMRPRIDAMMALTNQTIYSKPQDKAILKVLRLKKGKRNATPADLRIEASDAARRIMEFEWSHVTSFDTILVNNAFQESDRLKPDEFPISDPDLQFTYDVVMCLQKFLSLWVSPDKGYHIALELDNSD